MLNKEDLLSRITVNPKIMLGKPIIRIPVINHGNDLSMVKNYGEIQYDLLKGIIRSCVFVRMDGAMNKAPLGWKKIGPNPTDRKILNGKSSGRSALIDDAYRFSITLTILLKP